MLTPERQRAVDILYRLYEDVAHDQHLTLWESITTRRTLRNAIRYLTLPERSVFRAPVGRRNERRRVAK